MGIQSQISSNGFTGLRISELDFATGLAVWGFRAVATGHGNCAAVVDGFERALGDASKQARQSLHHLAIEFSNVGRRTFHLSAPGCLGVTHDEVCLIGAIYAAQTCQKEYAAGQLVWLLGRSPTLELKAALQDVADVLFLANYAVQDPKELMDRFYPIANQATLRGNQQENASNVRTLH